MEKLIQLLIVSSIIMKMVAVELDALEITTQDEFDEYLRKSDSFCPSGDVSECRRKKRHICLGGRCFKICQEETQCADGFTCNWEGLCKPMNCTPCIRKTMYPTPQPPSDQILVALDEIEGESQILSTALMVRMVIVVGVAMAIFWILRKVCMCIKPNKGGKKLGGYGPVQYGATVTSSV